MATSHFEQTESMDLQDFEPEKGQDALQKVASLLKVLAHPARVRILTLLSRREYDVTDLQTQLGISQSNVSQHLQALKSHLLVHDRREGKHVFYSVKCQKALHLLFATLQVMALQAAMDTDLLAAYEELSSVWTL